MSFQHLEWLFPLVITLHNAEESLWFPVWSRRAGRWYDPVAPGVFRFAVVILTLLAYLVTGLSFISGKQTVWTYLAFGSMAVTLVNVLIPHILASVVTRSYMPGLATGLALNLPVLSLLVVLAVRQGYVSGWKAAAYSVGVAALVALFIPALFRLGKALRF
jgi:hypothetical protein